MTYIKEIGIKACCVLLLLMPAALIAQKVKVNAFDKFLGHQRIEMEPLTVINVENAKLSIGFTSIASKLYLELSGFGIGASTIDIDNPVILQLSNNSTVTVKSTSLQSFEPGIGGSKYLHRYHISMDDVIALSQHAVVNIRKYMFADFIDFKIPPEDAAKLKRTSSLFIGELEKKSSAQTTEKNIQPKDATAKNTQSKNVTEKNIESKDATEKNTQSKVVTEKNIQPKDAVVKNIQAKDAAKHIGDDVIICDRVQITRFYESDQNKATILDFQSQRQVKEVKAIIWEDDLENFGPIPKAFFTSKDVCITGNIYLYNNEPYIRIKNKAQLRIISPIAIDEVHYFLGDSVTISGVLVNEKLNKDGNSITLKSPYSGKLINVVIGNQNFDEFIRRSQKDSTNKILTIPGKVILGGKNLQFEASLPGQNGAL